jgi:hypothetical protein
MQTLLLIAKMEFVDLSENAMCCVQGLIDRGEGKWWKESNNVNMALESGEQPSEFLSSLFVVFKDMHSWDQHDNKIACLRRSFGHRTPRDVESAKGRLWPTNFPGLLQWRGITVASSYRDDLLYQKPWSQPVFTFWRQFHLLWFRWDFEHHSSWSQPGSNTLDVRSMLFMYLKHLLFN